MASDPSSIVIAGGFALAVVFGAVAQITSRDEAMPAQATLAQAFNLGYFGGPAIAGLALYEGKLDFKAIDMAGWLRGLSTDGAPASAPVAKGAATLKKERNQARQGGDQAVQSYITGLLFGSVHVRGAGRSTGNRAGATG